jgi:hypothetical protein
MAGLTEAEKANARKKIAKLLRKERSIKIIVEANKTLLIGQGDAVIIKTSPERKPAIRKEDNMRSPVNLGEYVKVSGDSSPGNNRPEGFGFISKVAGVGAASMVTVKLDEIHGGSTHHGITMNDITPAIFGQEFALPRRDRKRKCGVVTPTSSPEPSRPPCIDRRAPIERLVDSLEAGARCPNRPKGWRRAKLGLNDGKKMKRGKLVMNHIERQQLLTEVIMLEQHLANPANRTEKTQYARSKKFKKRSRIYDASTTKYLVQIAWGLGNQYLSRLKKSVRDAEASLGSAGDCILITPALEGGDVERESTSVIDDYNLAEKVYTAPYLYSLNKCREEAEDNLNSVTKDEYKERFLKAMAEYDTIGDDMKVEWEMERRKHLLKQNSIKNDIIAAIRKNPRRAWVGIETDIHNWCSAATIRRWVSSRAGYKLYAERVIPLLSDAQKKSHFDFSKHFRNNWGLGKGKYLLIHYDEKWFWGLVTRKGARACEELGIDPHTFEAYHKSHINKTMGLAFVAFAFEDSIENGGKAVKLDFLRCQSYKVAEKMVKEGVRGENGRITYTGPIKRRKGDLYRVDCCVTGSKAGTADDPKFPLTNVFLNNIFPKVERLVGPGGEFEGYTPIFQGDNAGPHQDKAYLKFVTEHCANKGWHWEPQAAQMPHMNVLDLSVFPSMSRRHIAKGRERGGLRVLSEDDIWETALGVWTELPNSKIASGFIQAHRIAAQVIKAGGDNKFLGVGGTPHVGVRKDFHQTDDGLVRKDSKTFAAP